MLQNQNHSNAALLSSHGTSAHETGTSTAVSFSFAGNPYEDFAALGMDLQNCHIRFLRKPRNNGVAITGVFNISGIVLTAGGRNYAELVGCVRELWLEKKAFYRQRREEKKLRNTLAFINRHPDATILPPWLC